MSVKTFGSEILTSGDVNTYLANSGLVYVKSQAVTGGGGVSSVTISDAFSATYDNYKVIYSGGVMSATGDINVRIGGQTSNYYGSVLYCNYSDSVARAIGANSISSAQYSGSGDTAYAVVDIDVLNPFLTRPTIMGGVFHGNTSIGWSSYRLNDTSSHTSISFLSSANMIGGTITVYGYRKA